MHSSLFFPEILNEKIMVRLMGWEIGYFIRKF